jgi:hypothetical protein
MKRERKPKGLGDVVESITQATGIDKVAKAILGDDCGCEERKEKLNQLFPFGKRVRQCLTDEQRQYLTTFFKTQPTQIYPIQQRELSNIYKDVYGFTVDTTCSSCWRDVLKELKNSMVE